MAKQQKQKNKKPVRRPQVPGKEVPSELQEAVGNLRAVAEASPEGWATVADVLKQDATVEVEVLLEFIARNLGKEALPLFRGLALEEEEKLALASLRALPLLGSRAAGDVLAEAFLAHPDGERGRVAFQGVQALQAQGIRVSVPEPEVTRPEVYHVRETWESLPDAVGSRETIARLQDRYGVWRSVFVVWNDQAGVKDGFVTAISRRDWQSLVEDEARGAMLVKVPAEYARYQVGKAIEINGKTGLALEEHADAWNEVVGLPVEGYTPPDVVGELRERSAEERAHLVEHAGCLLESPFFQNWAFEPADLRPWYEEWLRLTAGESEEEPTTLTDADQAKLDELIQTAARANVTPEVARLYQDRLAEVAVKLQWDRQPHAAEVAAALALDIEGAAEHPGDALIFSSMVETGLNMLEQILAEGEDPEALRYDPMEPTPDQPAQ
jgi:hypothetical protein